MKLAILILGMIFFVAGTTTCYSQQQYNSRAKGYVPKDGFVPNAATAIKIAESVLINIYGAKGLNKPLSATLNKKGIWMISGTISDYDKGGIPYIEIQKSDGKVLYVIHGK